MYSSSCCSIFIYSQIWKGSRKLFNSISPFFFVALCSRSKNSLSASFTVWTRNDYVHIFLSIGNYLEVIFSNMWLSTTAFKDSGRTSSWKGGREYLTISLILHFPVFIKKRLYQLYIRFFKQWHVGWGHRLPRISGICVYSWYGASNCCGILRQF